MKKPGSPQIGHDFILNHLFYQDFWTFALGERPLKNKKLFYEYLNYLLIILIGYVYQNINNALIKV